MAIVKVLFRKNADNVIRYVLGHTQPGDPVDSECVPPKADGANAEFKMVRDQHRFKEGYNEAVHIIQSWNESDSQKLTPETINEMGRNLVGDYFKGHQFLIVTHTETGKVHNHIVVNTVNYETGKLIQNKYKHLHELRKVNDRLCLEKGLGVPNLDANNRRARIPQKVQQMVKAGRPSWVYDLKNKADVARFLATSHDQYVDYMDALGVKARVEEKNITYFYPGRSRGKRGDKMGSQYDKAALEKQYQQNDERFRSKPEIRQHLLAVHGKLIQEVGNTTPVDYTKYTPQSRKTTKPIPASERELTSQIIPAEEIRKAKGSILGYCKENNIGLTLNPYGQTVLKSKNHVVINDHEATNTRNGTTANLIDFVAAHHRLTLLQAVAKINGSANPLFIEQHYGVVDRKYTSFYIPKPDQMPFEKATVHLASFLKAHQASPRTAEFLLKHQRAEVSNKGVIRLFGESDPGGALEFTQDKNSAWEEKKVGAFQRPFFKRAPRGNRLLIFSNPRSYLSAHGSEAFLERGHRDGILVLMEPNASHVENYLSEHKEVRKIQLFTLKSLSHNRHGLDFFNVLRQNLAGRGIELHGLSEERALSHHSPGLGL